MQLVALVERFRGDLLSRVQACYYTVEHGSLQ